MLILARDVTQLNRLLSMRQDFVANVSHELRTPLTVILGYLESLDERILDRRSSCATLIERLRSPAKRMKVLVDDLLLLTRLESSPKPVADRCRHGRGRADARDHRRRSAPASDGRTGSRWMRIRRCVCAAANSNCTVRFRT